MISRKRLEEKKRLLMIRLREIFNLTPEERVKALKLQFGITPGPGVPDSQVLEYLASAAVDRYIDDN
jgi:hypothetical protein